jgi:hypothetical protein
MTDWTRHHGFALRDRPFPSHRRVSSAEEDLLMLLGDDAPSKDGNYERLRTFMEIVANRPTNFRNVQCG